MTAPAPVIPPAATAAVGAPQTLPPAAHAPDQEPAGRGSKEAVLADLASERDKRQAIEAELATLRQEIEDGKKTAEQKQADRERALATERDAATVKALRYEVCDAKGLPLAAARFLTGATKAEIEEAAEAFKALGAASTTPQPATGLPGSPNAATQTPKTPRGTAGLTEAQKRFAAKSA